MTPIERDQPIKEKKAEALAELIGQRTTYSPGARDVEAAFIPPKIEKRVEEIPSFLNRVPFNILAIVTHEYKPKGTTSSFQMMNWIPGFEGGGWPTSDNLDAKIWSAFGISAVRFLDLAWVRGDRDEGPKTTLDLRELELPFVFGYNRGSREGYERLKETIWAIAMLPEPILSEALDRRHFLLISHSEVEQRSVIASITGGTLQISVEDLYPVIGKYKRGEIESDTPVVLFRHG